LKRLWFQFIRPFSEPRESKTSESNGEPQEENAAKVKLMPLKMEGDIWIYPEAKYYPSVISGHLQYQKDRGVCQFKILPAAIALEIGQMRRIDGKMSQIKSCFQQILSVELPYSITLETHSAFCELSVGDLVVELPEFTEEVDYTQVPLARGTAMIRLVEIDGIIFDEQVGIKVMEMNRLQLLQNEQAWIGGFFCVYEDKAEGKWGRLLVNHIRAAGLGAEPLTTVHKIVQRYVKA
jgi:hypothetical protein